VAIALAHDIVPAGTPARQHRDSHHRAAGTFQGQYVAGHSRHHNLLEKYFGILSYEKLTRCYSLGRYPWSIRLVTYGAGFFLVKPEEITLQWKLTSTSVIALNWASVVRRLGHYRLVDDTGCEGLLVDG